MMLHYFLHMPQLPQEFRHQSNHVEVIRYCVAERQEVAPGTSLAVVENWWGVYEILAPAKATLAKALFDWPAGATVQVGEPLALMLCDPDDAPQPNTAAGVRVVQVKREKPSRHVG
ncbi:MAG: hypothetical protein ACRDGM_10670 [bacterium]